MIRSSAGITGFRRILFRLALRTHRNKSGIPNRAVLDYNGGGFDKPGVTVLFGGDHGGKHCPISFNKINLSSPQQRKNTSLLSHHCPLVTFASVQCTKDSYDLMDSTVMPMIKEQLLKLKTSCLLVVCHKNNRTKSFRSYIVPCSIHPATVAFLGANLLTPTAVEVRRSRSGLLANRSIFRVP
jgi:hypothetical protein